MSIEKWKQTSKPKFNLANKPVSYKPEPMASLSLTLITESGYTHADMIALQ